MNVSPLDLRQQHFRTAFRGFDKVEVTSFLMAVADDYEQALRETDRLRQDLARLEGVVSGASRAREEPAEHADDGAEAGRRHQAPTPRKKRGGSSARPQGRSDLLLEKTQARARRRAARNRRPEAEAARRRDLDRSRRSRRCATRSSSCASRKRATATRQDPRSTGRASPSTKPRPAEQSRAARLLPLSACGGTSAVRSSTPIASTVQRERPRIVVASARTSIGFVVAAPRSTHVPLFAAESITSPHRPAARRTRPARSMIRCVSSASSFALNIAASRTASRNLM